MTCKEFLDMSPKTSNKPKNIIWISSKLSIFASKDTIKNVKRQPHRATPELSALWKLSPRHTPLRWCTPPLLS